MGQTLEGSKLGCLKRLDNADNVDRTWRAAAICRVSGAQAAWGCREQRRQPRAVPSPARGCGGARELDAQNRNQASERVDGPRESPSGPKEIA